MVNQKPTGRKLFNRDGFTLVQTLIFLSVNILFFFAFIKLIIYFSNIANKPNDNFSRFVVRTLVHNVLSDPVVVDQTFSHPSQPAGLFNCFSERDSDSCHDFSDSTTKIPLSRLVLRNGDLFYDFQSAQSGFMKSGKPCEAFNTDPTCNYKYSFFWRSECRGATCTDYFILLMGEFYEEDNYGNLLHRSDYDIRMRL